MVRLLTFGGLALTDEAGRSIHVPRHRLAILALLCVAGDRGVSRDKLLALLWPDASEDVARGRLDQMLHALRRTVGSASFSSGPPLRIDPLNVDSDIARFDSAMAAAAFDDALAIYRGPFLDGFHLPGLPEFERWVEHERAIRAATAVDVARRIADRLERAGDLAGAASAARRACELAPHDERAARRMIELLARSGDRAAALSAYEEFQRRLAIELDLNPSPETDALVARIRQAAVLAPRQPSARAESRTTTSADGAPTSSRKHTSVVTSSRDEPPVAAPAAAPGDRRVRPVSARLVRRSAQLLVLGVAGAAILTIALWSALAGDRIIPLGDGAREPVPRVILTEFSAPPGDTVTGPFVTEALRLSLAQSQYMVVMSPLDLRDALRRMRRPVTTRIDRSLADEIAHRGNAAVVIDGEIIALGQSRRIGVRVRAMADTQPALVFQETVSRDEDLLRALDRLARRIRRGVGEPARLVRQADPLEQVTTPSLEALRKFTRGSYALDVEGDFTTGMTLLAEAIALDSTFAMAHRKLSTYHRNFGERALALRHILQAMRYADSLPEYERQMIVSSYHLYGPTPSLENAIAATKLALLARPGDFMAMRTLAFMHQFNRSYALAESTLTVMLQRHAPDGNTFTNLARVRLSQGKMSEAKRTVAAFAAALPHHPNIRAVQSEIALAEGRYADAESLLIANRTTRRAQTGAASFNDWRIASVVLLRGRLADARRIGVRANERPASNSPAREAVSTPMFDALTALWLRGERAQAHREAIGMLATLGSRPPESRSLAPLAEIFAFAGDAPRTRAVMMRHDSMVSQGVDVEPLVTRHLLRGHLAIAEGRYAAAARAYVEADVGECQVCVLPYVARALDLAGQTDSARAVLTRYVQTPAWDRVATDRLHLAWALERLGQLAASAGDASAATAWYSHFTTLWASADAEFQPRVAAARAKSLARVASARPER